MVAVRYRCPRCGTVAVLERDAYLSDKSVTPYPLEGWHYVAPDESYDDDAVDGVRFVCGRSEGCEWRHAEIRTNGTSGIEEEPDGCGEPFYLNFVTYDEGEAVAAPGERESEYVELAEGRGSNGPG
ncbi:hypothetical protein, partial [Halarchaeum acidiphilum]|uniref:hypothetical protein n=1 Tax=Halarchaeum acidiphilum TaxID=489138 RepID=UPI000677F861